VRFFFDHNIAPKIARAVRELASAQGIEVVHLTDKFDPSTPDVEWISSLRREGDWIIVSGDIRISKSRAERAAW
jgi:ribonuclease BN (tRNA processing enzyme)